MAVKMDKEQRLQVIAQARQQSAIETQRCVGYLKLFTIFATYNTPATGYIKPSLSGGIQLPSSFLSNIALGFEGDALIVGFQKPTFEAMQDLKLVMGWVEDNANSYCLVLSSVKYGEHKLPQVRLSFEVLLPKIMQRMRTCKYIAIGKAEVRNRRYVMTEVLEPTAEFLQSIPTGEFSKNFNYTGLL